MPASAPRSTLYFGQPRGGNAQIKAMRQVAGSLRLDMAQFANWQLLRSLVRTNWIR